MSSFERACYEDFQTYIPEIAHETQLIYPSKLYESSTAFGSVSSSCSAVNHDNALTHYPTVSGQIVTPSPRQCLHNDRVDVLALEDHERKMTPGASNMLEGLKFKDATLNSCTQGIFPWKQELQPNLHESMRFSKSAYQGTPSKLVSHFNQSLCPTVSIRVDISCPLSPCSCDKVSCCCRDAYSEHPLQHPCCHGEVLEKQKVVGYTANAPHNIPMATVKSKVNSFANQINCGHFCSNSSSASTSNWQLKSDCLPEGNFKPFPASLESPAENRSCLERWNSGIFDITPALQSGINVTDDKKLCQWIESDCSENKLTFQKERDETLNSCAIKDEEEMRSVHYSLPEKSCVLMGRHFENVDFSNRSQITPKEFSFPRTEKTNPYQKSGSGKESMECIELMPINPSKIFGQSRFQTSGNEDEYSVKEEPLTQTKTWQSSSNQNTVKARNKGGLIEALLEGDPSSPIVNLSNLVAKIHPDHGNIMTGKKNQRFGGLGNEVVNKRRSHCVCPNCLNGLNSGTGNVQHRSHSCHYPGCGKVLNSMKIQLQKKGCLSLFHYNCKVFLC